ncbi:Nucleosome assembly protein [Entamoeba marina]
MTQSRSYQDISSLIKSKTLDEFIKKSPEGVSDNISLIREIDLELREMKLQYEIACIKSRIDFEESLKNLTVLRQALITGTPITNNMISIQPEGIPYFWVRVLWNCEFFSFFQPNDDDIHIFKSLIDIQIKTKEPKRIEGEFLIQTETVFVFVFEENPYFSNEVLMFKLSTVVDEKLFSKSDHELFVPLQTINWKKDINGGGVFDVLQKESSDTYHYFINTLGMIDFDAIQQFFEKRLSDVDEFNNDDDDD